MIALARFAIAGLIRAPLRAVVRVLVLAASSALLGAMVLFVGHSLHTMTASAARSVPLDWQGPITTGAAARRVAAGIAQQPGIQQAVPVATAPFAGTSHAARIVAFSGSMSLARISTSTSGFSFLVVSTKPVTGCGC